MSEHVQKFPLPSGKELANHYRRAEQVIAETEALRRQRRPGAVYGTSITNSATPGAHLAPSQRREMQEFCNLSAIYALASDAEIRAAMSKPYPLKQAAEHAKTQREYFRGVPTATLRFTVANQSAEPWMRNAAGYALAERGESADTAGTHVAALITPEAFQERCEREHGGRGISLREYIASEAKRQAELEYHPGIANGAKKENWIAARAGELAGLVKFYKANSVQLQTFNAPK
jgi:hypothetical protein